MVEPDNKYLTHLNLDMEIRLSKLIDEFLVENNLIRQPIVCVSNDEIHEICLTIRNTCLGFSKVILALLKMILL